MLGFAAYRRRGDAVVFTRTEVDPDAGQSGVGSRLVRAALDDVHAWIERHEEYADLVTDPDR